MSEEGADEAASHATFPTLLPPPTLPPFPCPITGRPTGTWLDPVVPQQGLCALDADRAGAPFVTRSVCVNVAANVNATGMQHAHEHITRAN